VEGKKTKTKPKRRVYESYMDPTRHKENSKRRHNKSVLPYIRPFGGEAFAPLATMESALSLLITKSAFDGLDSYQVLGELV
jgi:hypothetical protein